MKTSTRTALILSGIFSLAGPNITQAQSATDAAASTEVHPSYVRIQTMKDTSYRQKASIESAGPGSALTREQVSNEVVLARSLGLLPNPQAYRQRSEVSAGTSHQDKAIKIESAMGESPMNSH